MFEVFFFNQPFVCAAAFNNTFQTILNAGKLYKVVVLGLSEKAQGKEYFEARFICAGTLFFNVPASKFSSVCWEA